MFCVSDIKTISMDWSDILIDVQDPNEKDWIKETFSYVDPWSHEIQGEYITYLLWFSYIEDSHPLFIKTEVIGQEKFSQDMS